MHFCFIIQGFLHDPTNTAIVGPLVQAYALARELVQRGARVSYICPTETRLEASNEIYEGIEVLYIPSRKLPMRIGELALIRPILRAVEELRPDVVYTRGRNTLPYIAARYAASAGAVSIWNAARDRDFNGIEYVLMKTRGLPLPKRLLGTLSYSITMNTLFERGIRMTDVRIVQNDAQREEAVRQFPESPFHLVLSAVELPEHVTERKAEFNVLWMAGVKSEKRPEIFLDLAHRLADLPISFTMAGALLDAGYAERIELARASNPRFDYLGLVPFASTGTLCAQASILVNTSISEGFPNTYLQAWGNGLPVLTLCCDPSDVIRNHALGAVCGDVDGMEKMIRRYYVERASAISEGARIRSYVESHHSVSGIVTKLLELVDESRRGGPWPRDA